MRSNIYKLLLHEGRGEVLWLAEIQCVKKNFKIKFLHL
jgi:hypothetical protein